MKRIKNKDLRDFNAGPSTYLPPPKGKERYSSEARKIRHDGRRLCAGKMSGKLLKWCDRLMISCRVSNRYNAWKMIKRVGEVVMEARWTATTGHLTFCYNVRGGRRYHGKAHDVDQVIDVLEDLWLTRRLQ